MNLKESAKKLADKGRNGDTILAHITPEEAEFLKMIGGSGTINPDTGLPEFWGFGGFFGSIVNPIVNIVQDVVESVGGAVEDIKESPILPIVANVVVPGSGPIVAAAQTLDQGGSIEDAALNAGINYAIAQAIPSGTDTTGLDMGDVIPTTTAQLEGLYPTDGIFNLPVVDTIGLDMGDVIPTTPIDITSVIPEATPVAASTTLPIESQDPFGYTPPTEPLPITAQDPFAYTPETTPSPVSTTEPLPISKQDPFGYTPSTPLDIKTALNLANLGLTAASILNPPDTNMGGTGATWYDLQPIPEGWRPPVYQTEFTPIDLASIFQGADLTGTQWANQMQPVQFAPAPTMQDLTNLLQGIDFGQTAISNQSVKG